MAWIRLIGWWLLAWPSYGLYRIGLPSGYGTVSAKHMRALIEVGK
jgi:hypothetical protein